MKSDFPETELRAAEAVRQDLSNGQIAAGIEKLRALKDDIYAAIPEKQRISRGITWVVERISDLGRKAHRLSDRELGFAIQPGSQGLSLDVGHDVIQELVPVIPSPRLATVEQRQDVRMLERRCGLDLGDEALGAQHGGELGLEHLERDATVVPQVLRQVDGGHATLAQLALDAVAVAERGGQAIEVVCHHEVVTGKVSVVTRSRAPRFSCSAEEVAW